MSDDDSALAGAAAPEAGKGWSKQDQRTLIITVGGGLAANLGTVVLVGAAIAVVRQTKSTSSQELVFALIYAAVSLVIVAIGTALRRGISSGLRSQSCRSGDIPWAGGWSSWDRCSCWRRC